MKKILLAVVFLLTSLTVYSDPVKEGYFPDDRIVDAIQCTKFFPSRSQYMICLNYLICESDIVKNPKGKSYGFRIFMQRLIGDEYVWEMQVWEANMNDTDTKEWCKSFIQSM